MKIVLQRVLEAKVEVEGNITGKIDKGYLILLGVSNSDNKEIADKLFELGFDIDKKKIILSSNIKATGVYDVSIRISAEETAKISVEIIN